MVNIKLMSLAEKLFFVVSDNIRLCESTVVEG